MRFGGLVCLRSKIGGSGPTLREEAGEYWLNERPKHDLSTTVPLYLAVRINLASEVTEHIPSLREGHPEDKDKLEGVVESFGLGSRQSAKGE